MSLELIKVEAPKEISIEQVNAVKEAFKPHFEAMADLEPRYIALTAEKLVQPSAEQVKEARAIRLALVKTRTGTRDTHKELKADALIYGRYLDGMKKAQEIACSDREGNLSEIEKHFENIEKERVEGIRVKRTAELMTYEVPEQAIPSSLGEMPDEVWTNYVAGTRDAYYQRKEAERKAAEEAEAKAKAEAAEQERVRLENERLKAEAAEREKKEAAERAERERIEQERLAKEQAEREERRIADEKAQAERDRVEAERVAKETAERKAIEEKARIEREEAEAKLQAQKEATAKLEQEKAEREEAAEKVRAEQEAAAKKEAARVADVKHRLAVNDSVIASLITNDVPAAVANRLVDVLADGEIPHVTINY